MECTAPPPSGWSAQHLHHQDGVHSTSTTRVECTAPPPPGWSAQRLHHQDGVHSTSTTRVECTALPPPGWSAQRGQCPVSCREESRRTRSVSHLQVRGAGGLGRRLYCHSTCNTLTMSPNVPALKAAATGNSLSNVSNEVDTFGSHFHGAGRK